MAVEFKQITDKKTWDDYVNQFDLATFFNGWTWGLFEKAMGRKFEFYGIYRDGKLVGVTSILHQKAKRGKYLHLRHSPLLDWNDDALVTEFMVFIKEKAKSEGYHFVRMSPLLYKNDENNQLLSNQGLLPATGHELDAENTLRIDVTGTDDEIMAQMRKNTRYSVRKAKKIGVTVKRVKYNDESFEIFWKIFDDGVKRNKWVAHKRGAIKTELDTYMKDGTAALYIAYYEDTPISAAIFVFYNGKSHYHHSGSLTEFRHIPSTYSIIWEAIQHAKEMNFREVDLWGVSDPEDKKHPWYGLSLFKRGFGGKEYNMVHAVDLVVHPFAHVTRLYEYIERKYNGY